MSEEQVSMVVCKRDYFESIFSILPFKPYKNTFFVLFYLIRMFFCCFDFHFQQNRNTKKTPLYLNFEVHALDLWGSEDTIQLYIVMSVF